MASDPRPLKGRCLCGTIQYEVDALEARMGHCHCSMCRKFHGAAFATFGEAKRENFRWVKGEEYLVGYRAENQTVRRFCKKCGSSMTFAPSNDSGELIEFTLGTLDSPIAERPDAHIFAASKADWFELSDHLPVYLEGREQVKSSKD